MIIKLCSDNAVFMGLYLFIFVQQDTGCRLQIGDSDSVHNRPYHYKTCSKTCKLHASVYANADNYEKVNKML